MVIQTFLNEKPREKIKWNFNFLNKKVLIHPKVGTETKRNKEQMKQIEKMVI